MDKNIRLFYCEKHAEWYSNNCSNCMIDTNEPEIRSQVAREILTEIESHFSNCYQGKGWEDLACFHRIDLDALKRKYGIEGE